MMNKSYFIIAIFLSIFLLACSSKNENAKAKKEVKSSVPIWMTNPIKQANGKITAVGCADIHYKGISAQRKLAIQMAIDEIAMQTNTKVSKVSLLRKSNSSSSMNTTSLQEVNEQNISTKIMDTYTTRDGEICVWIIKN